MPDWRLGTTVRGTRLREAIVDLRRFAARSEALHYGSGSNANTRPEDPASSPQNKAWAGKVVTFSSRQPLEQRTEEIALRLRELILLRPGCEPPTCWNAFEAYTTRAMARRLAQALDQVLSEARSKDLNSASRPVVPIK